MEDAVFNKGKRGYLKWWGAAVSEAFFSWKLVCMLLVERNELLFKMVLNKLDDDFELEQLPLTQVKFYPPFLHSWGYIGFCLYSAFLAFFFLSFHIL